MRKLIAVLALSLASVGASADPYHHHGHRGGYYGPRSDWVAPLIVGGIVTYALTRPAPPVVVQQPVPVYPPVSSPPYPPYGYHYENILDAYCNCYRMVLVQN